LVARTLTTASSKQKSRFTATTGSAAILIDGTTIHHLLRLPTKKRSKKPLSGDALIQFQKGFNLTAPPCNTYIFIDEMSMIGKDCFYWIDQRARQATAQASLTFGGLSIILVGDFGQLPPVLDSSLFAEIPFSKRNDIQLSSSLLYKDFTTVVHLSQNFRLQTRDLFPSALLRLRNGETTEKDFEMFKSRMLSSVSPSTVEEFEKALHLLVKRDDVSSHNICKLKALKIPLVQINAQHSNPKAVKITAQQADNFEPSLIKGPNATVMLIRNISLPLRLTNGTTASIYDVLYASDSKPPQLPEVIVLKMSDDYTGPSFLDNVPGIIPIVPITTHFDFNNKHYDRKQLPVTLGFARTIHKAQGMNLSKTFVDIGKSDFATGLAFVGLSRVKKLTDLLLEPFSFERLSKIGKSKNFKRRKAEDDRLHRVYHNLKTKYPDGKMFTCLPADLLSSLCPLPPAS